MFSPMRELARQPEGKVLIISALSTVAVGTVVYSLLEGWSLLDSLYFCVVTLATIGFGDLHPTTDAAKLFTVGYIVIGVGIIAGFLSELGKQRSGRVQGRLDARQSSADARTTSDPQGR